MPASRPRAPDGDTSRRADSGARERALVSGPPRRWVSHASALYDAWASPHCDGPLRVPAPRAQRENWPRGSESGPGSRRPNDAAYVPSRRGAGSWGADTTLDPLPGSGGASVGGWVACVAVETDIPTTA